MLMLFFLNSTRELSRADNQKTGQQRQGGHARARAHTARTRIKYAPDAWWVYMYNNVRRECTFYSNLDTENAQPPINDVFPPVSLPTPLISILYTAATAHNRSVAAGTLKQQMIVISGGGGGARIYTSLLQ